MSNELDDFGFSFEESVDEAQVNETIAELQEEVNNLEAELNSMNDTNREIIKKVTVLMNNLKKNPEKDMIKWPNRVEAINKFLTEINELHNTKKNKEQE